VSDLARVLVQELADDPVALERLRELVATPAREPVALSAAAYTPATLAAEIGRTPRSIRAAITRGELAAVKRGRGWVIGVEAVAAWVHVAPNASAPAGRSRRRSRTGSGPMGRALGGR
jgi:hypothetical protein